MTNDFFRTYEKPRPTAWQSGGPFVMTKASLLRPRRPPRRQPSRGTGSFYASVTNT